jgi:hypothetical protein
MINIDEVIRTKQESATNRATSIGRYERICQGGSTSKHPAGSKNGGCTYKQLITIENRKRLGTSMG